jgi:hypothetical protein
MLLGYDYPLLGLFWTILWIYILIAWFVMLFRVIADIFKSDDMGGVVKTIWLLFVIFFPLLGVLVYVIARGKQMAMHMEEDRQARDSAFRSSVQDAAGSAPSASDEIAKLAALRDLGVISDAEFQAGKAKLLA